MCQGVKWRRSHVDVWGSACVRGVEERSMEGRGTWAQ